MSKSVPQNYNHFVASLKALATIGSVDLLPRILVVYGPSDFLRIRALSSLEGIWGKHDFPAAVQCEASSLDQIEFQSMWAQVSMFEPRCLYFVRRSDKQPKLATWIKDVKSLASIKSHLVFEFGEKIPAEMSKQFSRLNSTLIPCIEPTSPMESVRIIASLAKREGLVLADDALKLLLDSVGSDLAMLHNEIQKIVLVFHDKKEPIRAADIAPIVGSIREDHVFELFSHLRSRNKAKAQLLVDRLLDRGEKALPLTGIFSRFSREAIQKGDKRGVQGLNLCADGDITLKSSRVAETLVLGRIVDGLTS